MLPTAQHHRPFGNTGLSVPPIVFSAAPLGNACRVIPDQTKLALAVEWFKQVAPPVLVDASTGNTARTALKILGNSLRRLDVSPEEIVINIRLDAAHSVSSTAVRQAWDKNSELIGEPYRPQLACLNVPESRLGEAVSTAGVENCFEQIRNAQQTIAELKPSGQVRAIGLATNYWPGLATIGTSLPFDWVTLTGALSVLRHPPELLACIESLRQRQIAMIVASPFHGGFLIGGNRLGDRPLNRENDADRKLFTWRKSFAALCEGHGVTPAHASLQFALSVPGVAAVLINTSRPERVAENAKSAADPVPSSLWASMKEDGLLAADYPYL